MKRRLATLVLILSAASAHAWNGAGHRLAAAIAWRHMSPPARQAATALLARHPDYLRWTARAGDAPAYTAFLEASTWADDIRKDPRFHDDGREDPTPPFPGMRDTARHKDWHFVDLDAAGEVRAGAADRQINRFAAVLADPRAAAAARAYALPWLIHLIADIHQPLHVGSRDDEGGNRVEIEDPFNPRQPFTRLHAWWDDLPGPPWLRGRRLEDAADELLAAHPTPPLQGDAELWREESRRLGRDQAYPGGESGPPPTITAEFRARSREIAGRRVAEAGYRLGRLLEQVLRRVPRETD